MENSFKTLTSPAKSILIVLPSNPDFDSVAAATSLYLALSEEKGKEINVYCPSPMIVEFNSLVGVNKIKTELGNKNLAISFANYNPQGIEKVSWDIENGQFKLTVVPKVNIAPPNQDQVIVGYAGVAADLVILIGGQDETSFQVVKSEDLKNVKLVHIGTNELSIPERTISSLASSSSSVSEIAANLIKASGYKIDADIATDLIMGIEEGTNSFAKPGVTAATFSLIAELMSAGGRRISQQPPTQTYQQGTSMPGNVPSSWTEPKIFKGTSVS